MRRSLVLGVVGVCGLAVGCGLTKKAEVAEKAGPGQMPANTVMLSEVMRELSEKPGFTDALLDQLQKGAGHKGAGAALLTPRLIDRMREMILGKDWQGLDRFPGWTMREINPTVRMVGHVVGKDPKVEASATAGGAPSGTPGVVGNKDALAFIDLGADLLSKGGVEDLDMPSRLPGFDAKALVSELGADVVRGDGPNVDRAGRHAESARLAEVLNRLSLNGMDGAAKFQASVGGKTVATPQDLIVALGETGHEVMVADSRYFANFGHLHYKGQDVMMPFWVNSQIVVPETKRPLLVPVSHAEYEWFVRGPKVNAEVSFYFGIDGKAEFRTMDQLDQAWVMNRHAHEYKGADAVEVTRLSGAMVQTYMHQHADRPKLPFGGYYALGVCQDVVAAIELRMTGKTTLFPNTADGALFDDARDAEINKLIKAIPKDRAGRPSEVERIFGSLPVGSSDGELASVSIPGLGADLVAVHDAWTDGSLRRVTPKWVMWGRRGAALLGLVLGFGVAFWVRRRSRR
ncbi:hypothetical protein [Granulicella tundricola]|uniref:Uncharacterized protein n=1 Tax=Granulicella tundricola (strain ATCC BAA-1859 / DSM 23138 / MP5ACTX9) TaxID=1198114 RepID=E8X4W3_GRATM|nr:hypothetical protein [Granulicella tundricola]ADW70602.1 hypothetical protein AciX9_3599 [Granulicella tundricola MP5ACTX9]